MDAGKPGKGGVALIDILHNIGEVLRSRLEGPCGLNSSDVLSWEGGVLSFASPNESHRIRVTCDFDGGNPGSLGTLGGKYRFDLDFTRRTAEVACLSHETGCGMHVQKDVWKLAMNTAGRKGGVSLLGSPDYKDGYVTLLGSNHDDGELLVFISYGTRRSDDYRKRETMFVPVAHASMTYAEDPTSGFFTGQRVECQVQLK